MATATQQTGVGVKPPENIRGDNLTAKLLRQKIWMPANQRNNWVVFVMVGREGSGKSVTTASILERVDPTFDETRIHFSLENFLEDLNEIPAAERQGKAMMLDEAGVSMGVRSWYDKEQINMNKLLQTARDDNMIIGITLPRLSELDSQFRGRLHGFCEMRGLKKSEGYGVFSWKNVSPRRDEKSGLMKPYPQFRVNGRLRRVSRLKIGPPTDELLESYDSKKAEFKRELYEETLGDVKDDEEEAEKNPRDVYDEIMENEDVEDYISVHGGNGTQYVDSDIIELRHGLSIRKAKKVKKLLEREVDDE